MFYVKIKLTISKLHFCKSVVYNFFFTCIYFIYYKFYARSEFFGLKFYLYFTNCNATLSTIMQKLNNPNLIKGKIADFASLSDVKDSIINITVGNIFFWLHLMRWVSLKMVSIFLFHTKRNCFFIVGWCVSRGFQKCITSYYLVDKYSVNQGSPNFFDHRLLYNFSKFLSIPIKVIFS